MGEVRLVRGGDLVEADPTPGVRRARAVESGGMWAGIARTEPGTASAWHHHGDHESSIYVLTGAVTVQFGPGGARSVEAGPGDFVYVPRGAVHRELNPTGEEAALVVVRAGQGVPTVNVDGPDPV